MLGNKQMKKVTKNLSQDSQFPARVSKGGPSEQSYTTPGSF
jgi:hypothetical protein